MKAFEIILIVALVIFSFVPVNGIGISVSCGTGTSSDSTSVHGSVDKDVSVDGEVSIDQGSLYPSISVTKPETSTKGGNPNPGIVPPGSKINGLSYGDWNAQWWKWALSMPVDENPLYDTAPASTGQSGNVWFIGSNFAAPSDNGVVDASTDREITVPAGTRLYIPLFNVEASTAEDLGKTKKELKEYDITAMSHVLTDPGHLSAKIDGMRLTDLTQYRAQSGLEYYGPLPDNNVLQALGAQHTPAGTVSKFVADGYCLMTTPLSAGDHSISWRSFYKDNDISFVFKQNVNYKVKVQNCPK